LFGEKIVEQHNDRSVVKLSFGQSLIENSSAQRLQLTVATRRTFCTVLAGVSSAPAGIAQNPSAAGTLFHTRASLHLAATVAGVICHDTASLLECANLTAKN
jgi:hypothetical protein